MRASLLLLASALLLGSVTHAAPLISTVDPVTAPPGAPFALLGEGFGTSRPDVEIRFMAADTLVTYASQLSDTQLSAPVPLLDPGVYDLEVVVSGVGSNVVSFTVDALPAVADPRATILAYLDDLDGAEAGIPDLDPGTPLCEPSPAATAFENLESCRAALEALDGQSVDPEDISATMAEIRGEMRAAVDELPPAGQLLMAQLLTTSGALDVAGDAAGILAPSKTLGFSSRCLLGQVEDVMGTVSNVLSVVSAALGPFDAALGPVGTAMSAAGQTMAVLSCLLNLVANDLQTVELSPASAELGGDGLCIASFVLYANFDNGCLCYCDFTFDPLGLVHVFIPIPNMTASVAVPREEITYLGTGPIAPDPEYPVVRATDEGSGELEATVECKPGALFSSSASITVQGEVCDSDDDDCDGVVDDGLLCCNVDCSDGLACTIDSCNPNTGLCVHAPKDCPPTVPCQSMRCVEPTGECVSEPVADGEACDDGKNCTLEDHCQQGECVGSVKDCSHLDTPCSVGKCAEPDATCVSVPLSCDGDDHDPCTEDFFPCDPIHGCHREIIECVSGDGCCPEGCDELGDSDCDAVANPPTRELRFHVSQNTPNPFNPATTIRFQLAKPGMLSLRVFDVQGRQVRLLRDEPFEPGDHEVHWDGRDDAGRSLASGVYYLVLRCPEGQARQKLVLLR